VKQEPSLAAPKFCRPAAFALFAEQSVDWESDRALERAAIAIAMHELEDVDPAAVEAQLDALAQRIRARVRGGSTTALLAHAHDVLFEEEKFRGNARDYYNPHNSYLPIVLRDRQGLPITLALVYKAVLGRLGLSVTGVNAPGHFLVCVEPGGDAPMLVDAFTGGRTLNVDEAVRRVEQVTGMSVSDPARVLGRASHRLWLSRMLANLENIFLHTGAHDHLAAMLELRQVLERKSRT